MLKSGFHIDQIIELLKTQEPDRIDLIEELEKSELKTWVTQPYVCLVPTVRPNQPNSDWQFDENIVLEHETEGIIVLDILKDGRVGGIEFLSHI